MWCQAHSPRTGIKIWITTELISTISAHQHCLHFAHTMMQDSPSQTPRRLKTESFMMEFTICFIKSFRLGDLCLGPVCRWAGHCLYYSHIQFLLSHQKTVDRRTLVIVSLTGKTLSIFVNREENCTHEVFYPHTQHFSCQHSCGINRPRDKQWNKGGDRESVTLSHMCQYQVDRGKKKTVQWCPRMQNSLW